VPEPDIEIGDIYHLNIYVQEDHPEVSGVLGAGVFVDFPESLTSYQGPYYTRDCVPTTPWNVLRQGARYADVIRDLGGITDQPGHGDGEPVLLASIPFRANLAGMAHFDVSSIGGIALPSPVGQLGEWRIDSVNIDVPIGPDTLEPLVKLTVSGPTEPVALGNSFVVNVHVAEVSSQASGVLGGPFDLYFDESRVSVPNFDPALAIQPPYTDVGLVSGTLLENRIDELGGATVATGYGNSTPKLYATLTFNADALGEATFRAKAGSTGFALSTPVGNVPVTRIDYGGIFAVDIRQNYVLTVNSGSFTVGNGSYVEGKTVPVSANSPATGTAFSHWEGDVAHLADANAADTDITMPAANIAIAAIYVPIDYMLAVNSGSGTTPTAHYAEEHAIQADPPATGKAFDQWVGDTASATVTMPAANVAVTAAYRDILYTLAVDSGSGDTTSAIYQQQVWIAADPAPTGYQFSHWNYDAGQLADPNASGTTVTMPAGHVNVTAVYSPIDYALAVSNGTGSTTTAKYGDVIDIAADPAAVGQAFAGWNGDIAYLADPLAPETSLTMPAQHIAVTALYEPIPYTLLVVNGTGSGVYHYGDTVDITADPPAAGEPDFTSWIGHAEHVDDPDTAVTTVTMPAAHIAIVAVYGLGRIAGDSDVNLTPGWNCFSVPYPTLCPAGQAEYAELITGPGWQWNGTRLVPVDCGTTRADAGTLQPTYGYWVYSPNGGLMHLPAIE